MPNNTNWSWFIGPVIISLFNFIEEFQRYYFNPIYPKEIVTSPEFNITLTTSNTTANYYYVLLTNTLFVPIYSFSQVIFGVFCDKIDDSNQNSTIFLLINIAMGFSILAFSYSNSFSTLIIYRSIFAIFYAGVDPLAAKEIFRITKAEERGKAMAIYNWAMYVGFGLAFGIEGILNWRIMFRISAFAILPCCTVYIFYKKFMESLINVHKFRVDKMDFEESKIMLKEKSDQIPIFKKITLVLKSFLRPNIFMLLLSSTCRSIAAGSFATFGFKYFSQKFPDYSALNLWFMIAPILGGIIGISLGGMITDFVLKRKWFLNDNGATARSRIIVQACSQILAGPMAWMAIKSPQPYCFVFLTLAFVLAEMWYGVLFAVLFEIVPSSYNTTFFTIFILIFVNASAQVFNLVDLDEIFDLAIQYFYPVGYSLSGLLFFGAFLLTE